jgi:hypothetical protein
MDPKQVVVVAIALLVLIAIVWMFVRKQRTIKLKERFGPEYDRVVRESGPQLAEAHLLEREKRVQKFSMRELPAEERESLVTEWRLVQAHFVDNPQEAVSQADLLVDRVMQARGYPVAEFEQQAADISVHHPKVVDNYRAAHLIAERHRQGQASTEDLRTAIIYYRSLFDELLGQGPKLHTREVA